MKSLSVIVCDSQPIVIEGLKRVLETCPDLSLSGETVDPEDTARMAAELHPDLALVDQGFGARIALDLILRIRAVSPATQAVLWATSLSEAESFRTLQTGARGILKKSLPVSSVVECLRAVGQGHIWIDNSLSSQMVGFLSRRDVPRLTSREHQVVGLVCRGMKNREIAETLSITTGTVKVHLMHIFEKVGVKDRFELAMEARKLVDLRPEDEAAGLGRLAPQYRNDS